jgi:polyketide synthase 12
MAIDSANARAKEGVAAGGSALLEANAEIARLKVQLRESVADPTQTRFVELMSSSAVAAPVAVAKVEGPLASALAALPASQRQPHVESLVLRAVRELTGDAEASVTASTPLVEAGIDSLAATELSSRLRAATGLALSPTLVFEQPTPRAIAAHVLEQLAGAQPAMVPVAAAVVR